MSYITVQEAAKKWGISERLVRRYCAEGRIPDLAQYDGIWQIPEDADKPSRIKKDTVNTPQIPPTSQKSDQATRRQTVSWSLRLCPDQHGLQ